MKHNRGFLVYPDGELATQNILDGYAVSATFSTPGCPVNKTDSLTLTVKCPSTGSPEWTVKLQGCIDASRLGPGIPDERLDHWFDLSFVDESSGAPVTSQTISGASEVTFLISNCEFDWIRAVFTRTSGSMTLTCKISQKGDQ